VDSRSLALNLWEDNPIYQLFHMAEDKVVVSIYQAES